MLKHWNKTFANRDKFACNTAHGAISGPTVILVAPWATELPDMLSPAVEFDDPGIFHDSKSNGFKIIAIVVILKFDLDLGVEVKVEGHTF